MRSFPSIEARSILSPAQSLQKIRPFDGSTAMFVDVATTTSLKRTLRCLVFKSITLILKIFVKYLPLNGAVELWPKDEMNFMTLYEFLIREEMGPRFHCDTQCRYYGRKSSNFSQT